MSGAEQEFIEVTVRQARLEADGVLSFDLVPDSGLLPAWDPGAHLDLVLPSGLIRQYSLCSPPEDRSFYRIAVLRETDGRGGSAELHDAVLVGRTVKIRGPRNHFPLEPAPRYLFIAGGIGITPMLAMVIRAEREKSPYRFVYVGRELNSMAFRRKLAAGPHVEVLVSSASGRPDLGGLVGSVTDDTLIYACGPKGMLEDLETACAQAGRTGQLRLERFVAGGEAAAAASSGDSFEVELARTGTVLTVGPDDLMLDVIRDSCPELMTSCEEGYCGTCETKVLVGEPEHHDTILSEKERAAGRTMMVCVGRSKSPRLVLDL